jgi:tetratricopeptide (TPR) repeat protein
MSAHLDDFALWLYAVEELAADQLAWAAGHLSDCRDCAATLREVQGLNASLRRVALGALTSTTPDGPFEKTDPFRRRPVPRPGALRRGATTSLDSASVLRESDQALTISSATLSSLLNETEGEASTPFSLTNPDERLALLYTLQEAGRQSARNPLAIRRFAQETIDRIRLEGSAGDEGPAGRLAPRLLLRAHAHLLLAITLLWFKEFSRARAHLIVAYRSFASAGAQDISFALVELTESQRRSLSGEGRTSQALARRARDTFEGLGMEDYAARATVAEGLAHCALEEHEDAVRAYRAALPIFERYDLWSNYVGALNSAATSLTRLGRFEEARRDYARALRRFSQDRHRYWLGYLRIGLAEALFAAARFADAALAASRAESVFEKAGLRAHQLIALLLEVESWARAGNLTRARLRLDLFRSEVERDHALDPAVQRELVGALSGANPDYQSISTLRRRIDALLEERYRPVRA